MDDLLATIRAAGEPDAAPETRAAAVAACRTLLAALGEPVSAAPVVAPMAPPQIASMVAALRGVPPDQLLELAISRLRAALPAGVDVAPVKPLKFHIIPIPPRG